MIFFPQRISAEHKDNLQSYEVTITTNDQIELVGWYMPNDTSEQAILYFGGNAEEVSHSLLDLKSFTPTGIAGFNYRGFGESQGKSSADNLRKDALVVFDELVKVSGIQENNWIILGRSLGSHMAALVASQRNVRGLILVTPYDSITEIAVHRYPIFPVRYLLKHHFNTVVETKNIKAPTLIIKSQVDYTVPHSSTDRLLEQWQGANDMFHVTIANTSHGNISYSNEYWNEINLFQNRL